MTACIECHDTGLIISKTIFKGGDPLKHYHIESCFNCGLGSRVRAHTMMHSQNEDPCDCEYRYVLDYWK